MGLDVDPEVRLHSLRYLYHVPTSRLRGGTTSRGDREGLLTPPGKNLGSRPFQRFTARRASLGTILVMNSQEFTDMPEETDMFATPIL